MPYGLIIADMVRLKHVRCARRLQRYVEGILPMRTYAAAVLAAVALIAAPPANATDLISKLWPATDAELGAPDWSGFAASPRVNYTQFDVTGDAAPGFDDLEGLLVGGQLAYDWHYDHFVFGVETAGQLGFAEENGRGAVRNFELELGSFGLVAGRAGFTYGRFLVFGKGGGAFARLEASGPTEETENMSGWIAGGGVEYAWNEGTFLRFEYNRVELDEETFDNLPAGSDEIGLEADIFSVGFTRKLKW